MNRLHDLLSERYDDVAPALLAPVVDCVVALRRHFEGDLDAWLVFLLVAVRTAQDPRAADIDFPGVRRGEVTAYPSLTTNVRSIAASTGVPYETARRKVARLLERGWIERRGEALALTVKASLDFESARACMFRMVEAHHRVAAALLAAAGEGA
jgi:hypothetical protein